VLVREGRANMLGFSIEEKNMNPVGIPTGVETYRRKLYPGIILHKVRGHIFLM
jgi:hypothetical protein